MVAVGSDTAVQFMTLLKMMLGPDCPFSVIAVAAMKPLTEEGSEGLPNFRKAFEHITKLHELGMTAIALRVEGGLYDPTRTQKVKDDVAAAFKGAKYVDTEQFEKVAQVDNRRHFRRRTEEDLEGPYEGAIVLRGTGQVKTIHSEVSMDPFEMKREIRHSSAKAFLVETYPSFTQATNIQKAILEGAGDRPIFYINSIPGGSTDHEYEIAKSLVKQGVYPLALTAHAARAKLNYAIQLFGNNREQIVDFMMRNNFVGEQPEGFMAYSNEVLKSAEGLKKKVYEAFHITPEMIALFESEEFRVNQLVLGLTAATRERIGEADLPLEPGAEIVEDHTALFALYSLIKDWEYEEMIQAIQSNTGGIQDMLQQVDKALLTEVMEGAASTVAPEGMPIELIKSS